MQKQTKMLQFRRTFENEQIQLQDLNTRLKQYLSRVKDLEQDNALLITEINTIKQQRTAEWEKRYINEMRELRKAVNQLTLEKSKAEIDREKLRRELQAIQARCCEETVIYRDIEGERKGCEKQLQQALKKNAALEERLVYLENEYVCLEDAHKQDISHLRKQVHSRTLPVVTRNYQGHPAVTMEEIEQYAYMISESLNENFEVYCRRIEDLENSIKADQAKLEDLHQEKTQYVSELKKLRSEANKQNKLQLHLEDQIMQIQDRFYLEMDQYQAIIGELEEEHKAMAHTIAEKLKQYQELMQVKMGLSLEVATYRALLEGERKDPVQKMDPYARETSRRIDIKMPAQAWSTTTRQEVRKPYSLSPGPEARYMDLASSLKASFGSTNIRSTSPARIIPITPSGRNQQSTPARRDMPSFTKASHTTTNVQKTTVEERSVRTKEPLQKATNDSANQRQPGFATRLSPGPAPTKDKSTVVTTSSESTVVIGKKESKHDLKGPKVDKAESREENDANKVTVKEWKTPDRADVRTSNIPKWSEEQTDAPQDSGSSERLPGSTNIQKIIVEERIMKTKEPLQKPEDSANQYQSDSATMPRPGPVPVKDRTTVVMTTTESTVVVNANSGSEHEMRGPKVHKTEDREEKDANKVTVKDWTTPGWEDMKTSNVLERTEVRGDTPGVVSLSENLPATTYVQKTIVEERSVRTKEPRQKPEDSANQYPPGSATMPSPGPPPTNDKRTMVTTSTESTVVVNAKGRSEHEMRGSEVDKMEDREEKDANKVTVKDWTTPDREDVRTSNVLERSEVQSDAPGTVSSSEKLPATSYFQKTIVEERSVRTKEPPEKPKDSANQYQPGSATMASPGPAPTNDKRTVVTTSTESTVVVNAKGDSEHDLRGSKVDKTEDREEKVTVKEWTTPDREDVRISDVPERSDVQNDDEAGLSDEKMVDYIYMEEIIEKVMRPAGLETKFISSSPDSKVAYRVEKTEGEDGKTQTQIILESRMEEDVDVSDDSALEELLSKGVKKVALDDIKGTPTGNAIQNLLSLGHHGGAGDLENKSVNVEIIEEPAEDRGDEGSEANPTLTFCQPSSMFFQIEELDNDSHGAKLTGGKTEVSKPTPTENRGYQKVGSSWVQEGYQEAEDPYFSHPQETEYFVSTPDDSISESEEERGISSYGHYGVVDDLSDERYYQEAPPINPRFEEDKGYRSGLRSSYLSSELGFSKDRFPECIIEEEVQVSPTVQESVLELLKEDSMDPEQQLRGALDKLHGNVSESLQDELSRVTKNDREGPGNRSVTVKKVQEVLDNRTVELKDLEDSDLLEDSESPDQAQDSSRPGVQHSTGSRTVRKFTVKITGDQEVEPQSIASAAGLHGPGLEGFLAEESTGNVHKTERVIRLGPSERSLTFQMDIGNVGKVTSLPTEGGAQEFQDFFSESLGAAGPSGEEGHEGVYTYVRKTTVSYDQGDEPTYGQGHEGEARKWDDLTRQQAGYSQVLQTQFFDPQLTPGQEKKIATVYLESD